MAVLRLKRTLRQLLDEAQLEQIADLAGSHRRVLGGLVALTFDAQDLIGWRAVEAMGLAADRIAATDPACVVEHLRRLHWLLSEESGGICWRAPQAIAEIVRHRPEQFADFIPIVTHLLVDMAEEDLKHFRPGILWAIARLGPAACDHLTAVLPAVTAALDYPDPQVRGMAVCALAHTGHAMALASHPELHSDPGPVDLYEDRNVHRTTVGALTCQAVGGGAPGAD